MSFTSDVKQQIAANILHSCCEKAQLSALVQMCGSLHFTQEGMHLSIQCEHAPSAKRIYAFLKNRYAIRCQLSMIKKMKLKKNNIYVLKVQERVVEVLKDLQLYSQKGFKNHPNISLVSKECCGRAYLAGAFLAKGSVNSPSKADYHLEITSQELEHAEFICKLMKRFGLPAKQIHRRNQQVVYIKASDKISDFLRCVGASDAVFTFEDSRIQRDFMNSLTRLDNCEVANEIKSITAGKRQLKDIESIEKYRSIISLPKSLQHAIIARKALPEASLLELCEYCETKFQEVISKSGMKHRFMKIKELAKQFHNF